MSSVPPHDLTGTVLGGRYRLDGKLASGGMGVVYAATDTRIDRKVAVKVVHSHLTHDASIIERFRREAEAAGGLEHPHIVQITDFVASDDEPAFLVMELLQGEPLSEVVKRERTLSMRRTAYIAWQVLDALGAAHAAGIVHRDLKPANVFLTTVAGVHDVVKLVDFGVAKLRESTKKLTKLGDMLGTPAFMAPEQVKGSDVDGRADLYSLGVVMYGCLAGSPPFWSADPSETLRRVLAHDYAPLVSVAPTVDPALAAVVERALSMRPDDRYPNAAAMRVALAPWVDGAGAVDAHASSTPSASLSAQGPLVDPHGPSNPGREAEEMSPRTLLMAAVTVVLAATVVYLAAQLLRREPRESTRVPPPAELLTTEQQSLVVGPTIGRGLLVPERPDASRLAAPDAGPVTPRPGEPGRSPPRGR